MTGDLPAGLIPPQFNEYAPRKHVTYRRSDRRAPFPFSLIDPSTVLVNRHPAPGLTTWPPVPAGAGGFLRSIDIQITGYAEPRSVPRPKAAADRTRSRRAAAGSRRTRRNGPRSRGPSGRPAPDWPFNALGSVTGYDLYAVNRFGSVAPPEGATIR